MLREQDVEGVRDGARQRERDPGRRQALPAAEDVDDQREPGQRQREGDPDSPPHGVVVDEPGPEGDEQRRQVLDQQRDPDRQAVNGEEVEPLHEGKTGDPEHDEIRQFAARQAEPAGNGERDHRRQADRRTERADLREALGREAGAEDRLRDGTVDPPEHGGRRRHRVGEAGTPSPRARNREGRLGHVATRGRRRRPARLHSATDGT